MAQTVNVIVAAEDRERLLAIAGDRNRPLKRVQRARIILLSAVPVAEVARRAGVSRRAVPSGKLIHAVIDNYATHKHPNVLKWLAAHPRWTFHFTPTSASWLNAVEGFFSTITRGRIRRGVFKSVAELEDAITRYIKAHNKTSEPFVWTATAPAIFEKLNQIPVPSE
jgi:transposase